MANCMLCDNEMTTATTCTVGVLHHQGSPFLLRTHEQEPGSRRDDRCGDCGAVVGGLHHLGCDLQECPRCARQLISCPCLWDEFIGHYLVARLHEGERSEEVWDLILDAFSRFLRTLAPGSAAQRARFSTSTGSMPSSGGRWKPRTWA